MFIIQHTINFIFQRGFLYYAMCLACFYIFFVFYILTKKHHKTNLLSTLRNTNMIAILLKEFPSNPTTVMYT